jgi:hypothetical protein
MNVKKMLGERFYIYAARNTMPMASGVVRWPSSLLRVMAPYGAMFWLCRNTFSGS